jgi:hypothetical protein
MVTPSNTSSNSEWPGYKIYKTKHTDMQRKNLPTMHLFHALSFRFLGNSHAKCELILFFTAHTNFCVIRSSVARQSLLPFPKLEFAASKMFFKLRKAWLACATVSPTTNLFVLGSIPRTPDKYTVLSITTA